MNMNIQSLHSRFCEECRLIKNNTPATIKWYKSTLRGYLNFEKSAQEITDCTTENIRAYLYYGRLERNWTPETFIYTRKGLKYFFKWCALRGYIGVNPVDQIEKPKLEKKLPKRITRQEALKLLDYSLHSRKWIYRFEKYRNTAVFAIMIFGGLRANEVLNLKMGEVDLENGVISVRNGKGGKDRLVPICSRLKEILKEYLKDRERLKKESVYFLTTLKGDGPYTYSGLKHVVEKLKKMSGVAFSCHRLRHTFATMMLEGGCDIFTLSKMLGHSDIKTTTIYLSASMTHMQEQIMKHPLN
ncbi:TPA: hypothetical protein DCW56_03635 [Candidatus Peregrinibacteria bacterium]|nr:MAG: Tyrosine recombinase XerD [Candidatus Peregrinibacteria bacterium GW2011_GWA2_43_8]HAU39997.1 hypothetical protein [Candidatus Peregrinibacteria bacterium]